MLEYAILNKAFKDNINTNMDFDKLSVEFKNKMLEYVISNWYEKTKETCVLTD